MNITKSTLRASARLKNSNKCKIFDAMSRVRWYRKHLEILEGDNYQEDPHSDLVMSKKIPKFAESFETKKGTKKKTHKPEYYQKKFHKNLLQLLEQDMKDAELTGRYSYQDLAVGNTEICARHICSVCGFFSLYVCVSCKMRYCSKKCKEVHQDTRCLKCAS